MAVPSYFHPPLPHTGFSWSVITLNEAVHAITLYLPLVELLAGVYLNVTGCPSGSFRLRPQDEGDENGVARR